MRLLIASLVMGFVLASPSHAQDQTLADIRRELSALFTEIQNLRRELTTSNGGSTSIAGDTLQRVDLIEGELQRLTARTETLEFRINSVVKDGTNRVGDLEFRLCELEPSCNIADLGDTPMLGGGPTTPEISSPTSTNLPVASAELAVGEQADFNRAINALETSDYGTAATLFADFVNNYPGGPMTGDAHFYRAEALTGLSQTSAAARAYLDSFSSAPNGRQAAGALVGLGAALGALGQLNEACVTLGEVAIRFPGSPRVADAENERAQLGCS